MSKLENELRLLVSRWQELGARHLEAHGEDKGDVPVAVAIRSQVEVVENRCTELTFKIDEWKAKGLL